MTTQPPTTRQLANRDSKTQARTSSVPQPQTKTTQSTLQSASQQQEVDDAAWRVAVIAGPVACVGLVAASAYCIRSWKKRVRAGLAGDIDAMELDELQNNRRNKGEHDKSI